MPSTGAPGNVWFPDDTSPVAPLENLFSVQALSVNVALAALGVPTVADLIALDLVTATIGLRYRVLEGGAYFDGDGTNWNQVSVANFATEAARNTAYNKVSGKYKKEGARTYCLDVKTVEIYRTVSGGVTTAGWMADGPKILANTGVAGGNLPVGSWVTAATLTVPPGLWKLEASGYFDVATSGALGYAFQIYDSTNSVVVASGFTRTIGPTEQSGIFDRALVQPTGNTVYIVRTQTSASQTNQFLHAVLTAEAIGLV